MLNKITIIVLFAINVLNIPIAFSDEISRPAKKSEEAIVEEIRWLQAEAIITIATKHRIPISKAPGIVSVITARQIKQMGFRTLADVLKTVPGIDISMDRNGRKNITARGVREEGSNKVKLLIDGHSVNTPWSGNAANNFYDLVVENAKRIEVIRGPGSALHGQNAFLAVVNVITKDTEDIDGFQWTASGGNFDTQNYNMLFGKEYGDLKISGFFDFFDTEGHSEKVEQDVIFSTGFSESPGRSQNEKEKTDLNLKLSYKNLEIKSKYLKKRKDGYIGLQDALNDQTNLDTTYIFSEMTYKLSLGDKLNITPRLYYDQHTQDSIFGLRPVGFAGVFPEGMKGIGGHKQRTIGSDIQFNYNVFERNRLTFGFQYEWIHQNDIRFWTTFHPVLLFPLPSRQEFSKTLPFTRRSVTRQIWALYLQDEWGITDDIDLTVGVRHDDFTRFGGTTNPRFGLVWRFMEDVHLKFLFATAFRAPNFIELFTTNNPAVLGNPSLDPEKINTFEIGLSYNFTKNITGSVNYFFNRIRDRIVTVTRVGKDEYENVGGARIKGVEAELRAGFGKDNYAYANYTFQDAEETRNRNRLPGVPVHKANFGINMGLSKYVNANLHTFISGPRPREDGDTRRDLPSHALVNLTLIGSNFMDNFEVRGSVFNLFDKGYEDPAPIDTVPTDYPQEGTSFMVELRYEF